ncbi:hypothetical protein BKA62DRAFT_143383 [Auriculariales sp. MPI-PUGE-AT-0066]|nr:hypothetical protein BKA62DRAFT_143383 [Auriculariales sp. MPI-PUGE-AT-0066]
MYFLACSFSKSGVAALSNSPSSAQSNPAAHLLPFLPLAVMVRPRARKEQQDQNDSDAASSVELDENEVDPGSQSGSDEKESLLQMMSMLTEVKKQKAAKLSSAYSQQKRTAFKNARVIHADFVANGAPYISSMLAGAEEIRVHSKPDKGFDEIAQLCRDRTAIEHSIQTRNDEFTVSISSARVKAVRHATETVSKHDGLRAASRKYAKRKARKDFEDQLENAQIATDARELLKSYRKLLMG